MQSFFHLLGQGRGVLFSTEMYAQCAKDDDGTEMRHVNLPALHDCIA